MTRIACTEFTTFIYFLALPFSIVWSFIGLAQHDIEGCGMASWTIRLVAVLALLYVVLHLFVALASCCWSLTREQRHTLTDTPSASAQQPLHQPGSNPQAGPGKLLQHMFAPGFENYGALHHTCRARSPCIVCSISQYCCVFNNVDRPSSCECTR